MSRQVTTTVRLHPEDVRALARARKDGYASADLIRQGLRLVAAPYYRGKRPPATRLFVATSAKLGDEAELFKDLEE